MRRACSRGRPRPPSTRPAASCCAACSTSERDRRPPMLSPADDLPIHQVAAPVRQPATSDRNFYDRYYFNCHPCSDDMFLIIGQGQYPNLGVTDAFALVRRGDEHRVVWASRELGLDRMDTSVGPFKVEVIEG